MTNGSPTATSIAKQQIKDILLNSKLSIRDIQAIPGKCTEILCSLPINAGAVNLPQHGLQDAELDPVMKILDICQHQYLSVDAALHLIIDVTDTLATEVTVSKAKGRQYRDSTDFFSDLLAECSRPKGER